MRDFSSDKWDPKPERCVLDSSTALAVIHSFMLVDSRILFLETNDSYGMAASRHPQPVGAKDRLCC